MQSLDVDRVRKPSSAKISNLREAAHYLQQLPLETTTFIIMERNCHPVKGEALADYFARLNSHLLSQVALLELSATETLRLVYRDCRFLPSVL